MDFGVDYFGFGYFVEKNVTFKYSSQTQKCVGGNRTVRLINNPNAIQFYVRAELDGRLFYIISMMIACIISWL